MKASFIVVDDFYGRPDAIREVALSRDFQRFPDVNYPGGQLNVRELDWTPARRQLRSFIPENVDAPCPKSIDFPQGLFRLALATDAETRPDGVHQDIQRWSGVIYLSRPQDCQGGVSLYRHRETSATDASPDWERAVFGELPETPDPVTTKAIKEYMREPSHWEKIDHIAMRFNRAVLLMAQCFHASEGIFGTTPESGRLTQHFEFYSEGDGVIRG
jgi:Family of unknown function (DUF6445)